MVRIRHHQPHQAPQRPEVRRCQCRRAHQELPEVASPESSEAAVGLLLAACNDEDELELLDELDELEELDESEELDALGELEALEEVVPLEPLLPEPEPLADTVSSGMTPISANVPHSAASATPAVTIPVRAEPLRTLSAAPPDPQDMAAAPFPACPCSLFRSMSNLRGPA
jgi:hypothetical protein